MNKVHTSNPLFFRFLSSSSSSSSSSCSSSSSSSSQEEKADFLFFSSFLPSPEHHPSFQSKYSRKALLFLLFSSSLSRCRRLNVLGKEGGGGRGMIGSGGGGGEANRIASASSFSSCFWQRILQSRRRKRQREATKPFGLPSLSLQSYRCIVRRGGAFRSFLPPLLALLLLFFTPLAKEAKIAEGGGETQRHNYFRKTEGMEAERKGNDRVADFES